MLRTTHTPASINQVAHANAVTLYKLRQQGYVGATVQEMWQAALAPYQKTRSAYEAIRACGKAHPALYAVWREC